MPSISKLSNEDLTHLYRSLRDNKMDDKSREIVSSLSDEELTSIYGSMSSSEQEILDPSRQTVAQSEKELMSNPLEAIGAAGIATAHGAASLPLGIAGMIPGVGKYAKQLTDKINQDPIYHQYPGSSQIGYGAGTLIGGGGIGKAVRSGAEKIGKYFPALSGIAGDTVKANIGREGLTGTAIGAALNPDNRSEGALWGGALGAGAGAIGGFVGRGIKNQAAIAQRELDIAKTLKLDIDDPQVLRMLQKELDEGGSSALLANASDKVTNQIQQKVKTAAPKGLDTELTPNEMLEGKISSNYDVQRTRLTDLEAPMRDPIRQQQLTPTNMDRAYQDLETKIKGLKLPAAEKNRLLGDLNSTRIDEKTLSVSEMLDRKRYISALASQKFAKIKQGERVRSDLDIFKDLQTAAEKDLAMMADKSGIPDAYKIYSKHYVENVKPYEDIINNGETFKKINTLLTSSNPNMKEVTSLVKGLGEDGKATVGWAIMQNALNKATLTGQFEANVFLREVNRYNETGLGRQVLTAQHKEVMRNIKEIAVAAKSILQQGHISEKIFLEKLLNRGIFSKAIIQNVILPWGKASAKEKRAILQNIITTTISQQPDVGGNQ